MFSVAMAVPAHLLEKLSPSLVRQLGGGSAANLALAESARSAELSGLALPSLSLAEAGWPQLDEVLPDGGLLRGGVVELRVHDRSAAATSIALAACRAAALEAARHGGAAPWCAFVDPSATLYAPGVSAAGVDPERLLVVRPGEDALSRVAVRLAESRAFSVIAIDTVGVPGKPLRVALGAWPRVVRRLAMGVEGSETTVLLVTDAEARCPLPLPVAMRIELERSQPARLSLRVTKHKHGRVGPQRSVPWPHGLGVTVPGASALRSAPNSEQTRHELVAVG